MEIERRFGVLRVISMILKILAWLTLITSVIAAVGLFLTTNRGQVSPDALPQGVNGGLGAGLLSLAAGVIYFILFYAFAESILVFVDIEENTRATAMLLRDHYPMASAAPPTVHEPVAAPIVTRPVVAPAAPVAEQRPVVEQQAAPAVPPVYPEQEPVVERVEEKPVRPAPPPAAPPPMPPGR